MNRRKFLGITGGSIVTAGITYYALSDKSNFERADLKPDTAVKTQLTDDERQILFLASLAPSGHNTQPWLIKYIEPMHWIICNDKTKWLPAVDPTQRETMLSIGAFIQNIEYAASHLGYRCQFSLMANTNQDEKVMEVKLIKSGNLFRYDTKTIIQRRTVRSNMLTEALKTEDVRLLMANETDFIRFVPRTTKAYQYLNEQTIEANKIQSYRNAAQKELADWIRFSNKDAEQYRDGLTPGSMEIEGISGWVVRNFYGKPNVMGNSFRDQNIKQAEQQVASSAGWFLITSKDASVPSLIETGRRMQRLFLKVRDQNIAIHPMTQILEEPSIHQGLNASVGITDRVQFILRTGYIKDYPEPVSLRRPVDWLIRS
ncbi:Acg family FMN-binding oxidoreductase [Mucilaginibacter paludis]|uniref:Nitroreductase n=1 Tax=Mucilaginibacter paludis DSM 18603 TaxID=714943 RepID=H1Y832_9SPHI|nr:nitroreductase [Mucilaginibacter paludis]EHQ31054.1 nitroreductase [Mucilaginibacter paludis DSM 18603]